MTQRQLALAAPESLTVCGVECSRVWGTSYVGRLAQFILSTHVDQWGITVAMHRGENCVATGHGQSLESACSALKMLIGLRRDDLAEATQALAEVSR